MFVRCVFNYGPATYVRPPAVTRFARKNEKNKIGKQNRENELIPFDLTNFIFAKIRFLKLFRILMLYLHGVIEVYNTARKRKLRFYESNTQIP